MKTLILIVFLSIGLAQENKTDILNFDEYVTQLDSNAFSIMTVYHEGSGLLVYQCVADTLHLNQGQSLNDIEFWELIRLNALVGIAKCNMELEKIKSKESI